MADLNWPDTVTETCIYCAVATGAVSIGHGGGAHAPTFTNGWASGGTGSRKTANQTVLTIMKALSKRTDCTCIAKKWRSTTKNFVRRFALNICPPLLYLFQLWLGKGCRTAGTLQINWTVTSHCIHVLFSDASQVPIDRFLNLFIKNMHIHEP